MGYGVLFVPESAASFGIDQRASSTEHDEIHLRSHLCHRVSEVLRGGLFAGGIQTCRQRGKENIAIRI